MLAYWNEHALIGAVLGVVVAMVSSTAFLLMKASRASGGLIGGACVVGGVGASLGAAYVGLGRAGIPVDALPIDRWGALVLVCLLVSGIPLVALRSSHRG